MNADFTIGDDLGRVQTGKVSGLEWDNANALLGEFFVGHDSVYLPFTPSRFQYSAILMLLAMPLTMLHAFFSNKTSFKSNPTTISA